MTREWPAGVVAIEASDKETNCWTGLAGSGWVSQLWHPAGAAGRAVSHEQDEVCTLSLGICLLL